VYGRSRVESHGPLLGGGKRNQEIVSLHIHCDKAMRYYVIYTSFDPARPKDPWQEDAMKVIADTFKCHS
jgi:ribulose-5-phosphate 4-epimerase/fuculose-1-phosphate aldolase